MRIQIRLALCGLAAVIALGGASAPSSHAAGKANFCIPLLPCYTLSIGIVGSGSVSATLTVPVAGTVTLTCTSSCSHQLPGGSYTVTLKETPSSRYVFSGWSGNCGGTGACSFTMSGNRSVTATFVVETHTLNVSKSGTGSGTVTSSPSGINCGATCSATYVWSTSVGLTATPAFGSMFAGWSGSCSGTGACSFSMSSDRAVTATFQLIPRKLTVAKNGTGTVTSSPAGISCGATCTATYPHGTTVNLTAAPAGGWRFSGWSGACTGTGACAVAMTADRTVTATFAQIPTETFALKVSKSGSGGGTVTSAPAGINCGADCSGTFASGTTVTLNATPAAGSYFAGWGGGCSGTGSCTVRLTAAAAVTATFVHPTVTVENAKVAARWSVSRLTGALTINGNASNGGELTITLRRRATQVPLKTSVGDGAFARTLKLPAKLLPGQYRMEVGGSSHGVQLETVARPVVVPAPAEGVVRRSYTSGAKSGRPTKVLPHGARQIWAIFEFAAKPKPGLPVTVSWYRQGKLIGKGPARRKLFVVAASVYVQKHALPGGSWTCKLEVGKKLVGIVKARIP